MLQSRSFEIEIEIQAFQNAKDAWEGVKRRIKMKRDSSQLQV